SVLAASERHGVPIADHAMPASGRESNELHGIGIDPAAWLAASADPAQAVTASTSSVLAARLTDLSHAGVRQPPGMPGGRLDVLAYRVALSAAGLQSPVVLDARQWTDPWRGITLATATWAM